MLHQRTFRLVWKSLDLAVVRNKILRTGRDVLQKRQTACVSEEIHPSRCTKYSGEVVVSARANFVVGRRIKRTMNAFLEFGRDDQTGNGKSAQS